MKLRKLIYELSAKFVDVNDINLVSAPPGIVLNLNLYGLYLLLTNSEFAVSLKKADYIHLDGIGAAIIVKIITGKYFKPVGYRQWGHLLLNCASTHGLLFIGGTAIENLSAVEKVSEQFNGALVEGVDGYLEKKNYLKIAKTSKSKIIVVGLGMPQQEILIKKLSEDCTGKWFFACGGWIKQLGGFEEETPKWISKLKLEWLHRSIGRKNHLNERVIKPLLCILKNF